MAGDEKEKSIKTSKVSTPFCLLVSINLID